MIPDINVKVGCMGVREVHTKLKGKEDGNSGDGDDDEDAVLAAGVAAAGMIGAGGGGKEANSIYMPWERPVVVKEDSEFTKEDDSAPLTRVKDFSTGLRTKDSDMTTKDDSSTGDKKGNCLLSVKREEYWAPLSQFSTWS
jgi:hypothetical protein